MAQKRRQGAAGRRRKHKQEVGLQIVLTVLAVCVLCAVVVSAVRSLRGEKASAHAGVRAEETKYIEERPLLDVQLLQMNAYSRPGLALEKVNGIVVHYTANPGTTAQQNRDYFDGLAQSHAAYASSHFVVGLGGEIIQCIPCNEMSYASNGRNSDTISIECCIADETGKFNDSTYQSLVQLVAWLMGRYGLGADDVIRHYDVTGKSCPKYFVDHPAKWDEFKSDVVAYIDRYGVEKDGKERQED